MTSEVDFLLPGSIENIHQAVNSFSGEGSLLKLTKKQRQQWISTLLGSCEYDQLSRNDKGLVRQYIQNETGYSRAQTARLISSSLKAIRTEPQVLMPQVEAKKLLPLRTITLTSAVGVMLLLVMSRPETGIEFLNADVQKTLTVSSEIPKDPFDPKDPELTQAVPVRTTVYSLLDSGKHPLFVQQENVAFSADVAVAYEKIVAVTVSELEKRVALRRSLRSLRTAFTTAVRPEPQAQEMK